MEGSYGWGGLREEGIMKTSVYRAWGIRVSRAKGDWESWIMKTSVYEECVLEGEGFMRLLGFSGFRGFRAGPAEKVVVSRCFTGD